MNDLKKKQEEKQLRVFGYGLPLICLFFAWRQFDKHGVTAWAIGWAAAAVIVLALALFMRPWLKVLFKYWMKGAHAIGLVITTVILTAFYFAVITPVAVVLRLARKDYLTIKRYKSRADSLWIRREAKQGDYSQQF